MTHNSKKVKGFHGKVRITKTIDVRHIVGFRHCMGTNMQLKAGEEYNICNNANRKERLAGVLETYFWDNEESGSTEFCFTISREDSRRLWKEGYLEIIDTWDSWVG